MNNISIYNKVAAVTNSSPKLGEVPQAEGSVMTIATSTLTDPFGASATPPKLGGESRYSIRRKASVLCTLCAVLLLASCTEDDLMTPPTPLAPQGTKTVTVDFQLPEGKPGFEVQSTETRSISNSSPESGEVALVPEGSVMTIATSALTDPLGASATPPNLGGELSYSATRATTAPWAGGDELLMKITVKGFDDKDGYAVYESYMMLAYDDSDGYWDMLEDKSTTVLEVESYFVANPDYVMLAQTTDIDLTQPLSIKVPEDMSQNEAIVSVTYAPELEWDITPDANGAVTDVNRKLKATATTTAPECWEVSSGEWSTNQARLRVNTGAAGDVVTITSENFYPNSIEESADGIYTATTDSEGNAYFYGEAGSYDDSDRITATTSGFNLSLTAVTVGEGNAAFTYHIAPVTLLEASTLVPVQLVGGMSYCLDATEKRTAVPNTIAEIDGASTDLDAVKTNIEQLLAAGKTTLVVTGKTLAPYSNENSEEEATTVVGEAIRQLKTSTTFSIVLPAATSIGESAFNRCTALTIVSLPAAKSIGDYAFYACTALTSVSLPAATTIGDGAFAFCNALTSVSLPAAETIGKNAFNGCTALASVSAPKATSIGESAFYECIALTSVSLPAAKTIGNYAFYYCKDLESVSLPAAQTIGEDAFQSCKTLTSVSLPAAETIGEDAFRECAALESVSLPEATTIRDGAFQSCKTLTSVSLPAAKTIGNFAFMRCYTLTRVSLPVAIMIGDYAFMSCVALQSVSLPAATLIGINAFYNCAALESVSLPAAQTIEDCAFYECIALTSVSLPAAETIGNEAFRSCSALESVSLPEATTIRDGAFFECKHLTSVSAPKATLIGNFAFNECRALTSVELPAATTIGDGAFKGCTDLTSVSAPAATTIGDYAFQGCTALKSLTFGSVIETVGIDAFLNVTTENCALTLNSGQLNSTGDLKPSGNTWAGETWASITLVNSN